MRFPNKNSVGHKGTKPLLLLLIMLSLVFPTPAASSEAPIIFAGNLQMSPGEQQVLSIMNYRTGNTYTWSIESGGGTLSSNAGERVTFTAPESNPDCNNNPTIRVECCDGNINEITIAINGWTGKGLAFYTSTGCTLGQNEGCDRHPCPKDKLCCRRNGYRCDGTEISAECTWRYGPSSSGWCVNPYYCQSTGPFDERSDAMKAAGCCPEALLSSYKPPSIPGDIDNGKEPLGTSHICPVDFVGNPISIYNGNNFESEQDFRFNSPNRRGLVFTRYYNSRSTTTSSLGYGWSHTYNLTLNPSHTFKGTTYLRIIDETGRGIYFEDSGNGSYVGVFKEKTIVRLEGGNFVWYKFDNSRCGFNDQGRLIWTEDKIGNRQNLTYDGSNRLSTVADEASARELALSYDSEDRLDYVSGPGITSVAYNYDSNNNLEAVIYADGSGVNYIYGDPNDVHNLTEKHDKMGHLLSTWTYDDSDRATDSFTRDGNGVSIDYTNDNQVGVTNAYVVTRTYLIGDIDGRKRVTHIDDPAECPGCAQEVVRLEYDSSLRIIELEYANGLINQYDDFDSQDHAQTVIEAVSTADERTIIYTFHPDIDAKLSEARPSILGAENKVTIWDYDDDGNTTPNENPTRLLSRKIEHGFTKDISGAVIAFEYITTYTYDSKGQVLSIDGPEPGPQDTTNFTYDSTTGDLLAVTRPVAGPTTYSGYNAAGQVGSVTDADGNALTYTYDGHGSIKTMTNQADSSVTTYDYNIAGELEQVVQPNGVTTDFWYGATYGRLTRIDDALGNYISYGYDTQGNRTELSHYDAGDQRKFWKRFDYQGTSAPGKLWKEIDPDDSFTEYTYDSGGNISSITDAASKATTYGYDYFDRLTTVTQPGSMLTSYGYDVQDNLLSVTDAENHTTTYVYDDLGRLVETVSPDTGTTRYAYDAAGNLISKSDANSITTTYDYDELNRLTAIHFPDSSQDITYTYDEGVNGKGRLTGMTDPSGSYTYSCDALGNLITEEKIIEGVTFTTQYAYDAAGILTGMTYPDGRTVTYALDLSGRVTEVTTTKDSVSSTVAENITYLPFGPLASMTYGNGTTLSKTFDQLYRLIDLNAGTVQSLGYVLDPAGNITGITNNLDAVRNQTFSYDDLYRLTSATGIYGAISYSYDKVGNRLTKTIDSQTDTYSYEAGANRIDRIAGANPQTFSYDANGNTTAIDSRTLTYNQNNRLMQTAENSTVLGTYTYNGKGRRVKKTAGGKTAIYHYDRFGNLIGESTPDGQFLAEYVYLNNTRLAVIAQNMAEEVTVQVTSSKGWNLAGVPVYAFTDGGAYTGKNATTDEGGIAHFALSEFPDGSYKFRVDYLSYQFWSEVITLPGTYNATVAIAEETATVRVIQGGTAKEGIKVYLFNASGSYLGIYGTTDENGEVTFDLPAGKDFKFRADNLGSQFFSEVVTLVGGGPNDFDIDSGGGTLSVTVDKGEVTPIIDIRVYLFNISGGYLGLWDQTDAAGTASFEVCSGNYKVRADYLGYQFWSDEITLNSDDNLLVSIHHRNVTVTVQGNYGDDVEPIEGLNVYLFAATGSYLGQYHITDELGHVTFSLPDKEYKARADYLSQQYWSDIFKWADKTITIDEAIASVNVSNVGQPVEGVNVYVFNNVESYLGLYDTTDVYGETFFRLPAGDYNFRGDYMGSQYWSGISTLISHVSNPIDISTGGGAFALTVLKGQDDPLEGVSCYLFNQQGSYLSQHEVTSSNGEVTFSLANGDYKIRIDHLGYQFWTDVFTIPDTLSMTHTIAHQHVTVTVEGDYNSDVRAKEGLKIYLFTPSGSYLGQHQTTDEQGEVTFNLPEMDYKVRADYMGQQYWSSVFNWADETIIINEGLAEVHVGHGAIPLENVNVYVFSASGSYLGIHGQTDAEGIVSFRLPDGTYKFRGDYQGSRYWATEAVNAHKVNVINLNTGGGTFTLTVEREAGAPLVGVPVYVFNSGGSYLGMTSQTNDQGRVSFDLSDGDYKFRADYLGYQFWSSVSTIPGTLSNVLTIAHQDVTITVEKFYQAPGEPIEAVRVYLFTESGSYQSRYVDTNTQGEVVFSLPEQSYKVRADYLGYQFWSQPFVLTNTTVTINNGLAVVHVTNVGTDIVDAQVYLFTASGTYLSRHEHTDSAGVAEFMLPDRQYKFRVDYDGTQYWSDVITIIPHEENDIDLNLDLLALDLTNDPNPVRFDGVPPESKPKKVMVASLASLTGLLGQAVILQIPEETIYYYINDHLGTPQKIIDKNGTVVWSADYEPFGETDVTLDTAENNFRFPGQYYDEETGLHYNYFRDYNPVTGRYLTPDPIGLSGGINLYAYVKSNPIRLFDNNGLFGIGAGIYWGAGMEMSYTSTTCCENNKKYKVKALTICGGAGLGGEVKLGVSSSLGGISSRGGCPRTRYYFKHDTSFLARSVGIQFDSEGPLAGVDIGYKGLGVGSVWVFCSDTVLSKIDIGCCDK